MKVKRRDVGLRAAVVVRFTAPTDSTSLLVARQWFASQRATGASCPLCHRKAERYAGHARALARSTDPSTSKQAAVAIMEALPKIHALALGCVQKFPRHTMREIADLAKIRDPRTVGRRLVELERLGVLIRGAARRCSVTRRNAATWTVNE